MLGIIGHFAVGLLFSYLLFRFLLYQFKNITVGDCFALIGMILIGYISPIVFFTIILLCSDLDQAVFSVLDKVVCSAEDGEND